MVNIRQGVSVEISVLRHLRMRSALLTLQLIARHVCGVLLLVVLLMVVVVLMLMCWLLMGLLSRLLWLLRLTDGW